MIRFASVVVLGIFVACAWGQDSSDKSNGATEAAEAAASAQEPTRVQTPHVRHILGTRALLAARLRQVRFEEEPLENAFEQLADALGVNVVVRWSKLEVAGIERDKPITLSVRNLRVSQVLWLIMNEAADSRTKLAYRASGNLIIITTEDDVRQDMIVRVYDVRDLIASAPINAGMGFGRTTDTVIATNRAGPNGLPGFQTIPIDSGVRVFTSARDEEEFEEELRDAPDRNMQELIDAITGTIDPETWAINGGGGTIRSFKGKLIIRNSPIVHQKIGGPRPAAR